METNAQNAKESPPRRADSASRVTYVPRADATLEGELAALAAAYAFVIQAQERKEAAASLDEDGREANSERRAGRGQ